MSRETNPSRTVEVVDTPTTASTVAPTVETQEPGASLRDSLPGLIFGILMIVLAVIGVVALAMATARASG